MACSLKLAAWGLRLVILFYLSLELEACGFKLDACCLELDACRLMLADLGKA